MSDNDEIMTLIEASKYLRVHASTVIRLMRAGHIPSFRVGSRHRFSRASLDKWRLEQEKVPDIGRKWRQP